MSRVVDKGSSGGRNALWILAAVCWVLAGFFGLKTFAMEYGAAQHDIHCPDHRAPVLGS